MHKRTRVFLFAAAGVLIVSLATGLVAWATRVSAAGATDELAYVPATALMVAYVDVRGLMNSPFHDRFRQLQRTSPAGSDDLEARTGIRFDTDVDDLLVASTHVDASPERTDDSLLIARGRFDPARIEGVMRSRGGQIDQYRGKRIVTLANTTNDAALSFAEPGLLLFGPQASVRGALDAKAGASAGIGSNGEFMVLVNDVSASTPACMGGCAQKPGTSSQPRACAT
jgi:hypothetical protein